MKIQVKAFGELRETLAEKLELRAPLSTTLGELFSILGEKYPRFKNKALDSTGKPKDFLVVLLNGRNIQFMEKLNTRLSDGDVVSLLPPSGGG